MGNILIPPLTIFYDKDQYLKPFKLEKIFNIKEEIKILEENKDNQLFKGMNFFFLSSIIDTDLNQEPKLSDFKNIVDELFLNYEYYLDYVGNIFSSSWIKIIT